MPYRPTGGSYSNTGNKLGKPPPMAFHVLDDCFSSSVRPPSGPVGMGFPPLQLLDRTLDALVIRRFRLSTAECGVQRNGRSQRHHAASRMPSNTRNASDKSHRRGLARKAAPRRSVRRRNPPAQLIQKVQQEHDACRSLHRGRCGGRRHHEMLPVRHEAQNVLGAGALLPQYTGSAHRE